MLEVDDLVVEYTRQGQPPLRAVDGVSLRIAAGEVVGIVGESGCGKSTLAKAIVGLVPPLSGGVRYQGNPVAPLRRRRRAAAAISLQMVFQDPHQSLNPRRTAGEQLRETARASAKATGRTIDEPLDQVVAGLLDRVGLPSTAAGRYPHEFSGGQRQRVAIARVLGTRPQLIVADEPVSALDASAQAQVANLLLDVAREEQIGLALISHDLAVVGAVSDRVAVMYLGEIVETGSTSEIWNAPRHPYTQALLSAIPLPDGQGRRPAVLTGEVGDPANPPSGCRFHPRCALATPRCRSEAPPAVTLETGTTAACWETDRTARPRTAVGDGPR